MRRLLLCLIATAVLAGCSLPDTKATPFFFDDAPGVPEGPAHERIALWPLLYHRAPATSVLWPIGEYVQNSHLRIWPLFTVKKLDQEKRQYRVLAPLSQFDFDEEQYHIFPVFWGKHRNTGRSRLVVFPLFWHLPGQFTALAPLFYHARDGDESKIVTPLFGHHRKAEDRYSMWALWPLLRMERDVDMVRRRVLPFYAGARDGDERWDVVPPLFYRARDADSKTLVTPLFGSYRKAEDCYAKWVLPLFYYERDGDETRLVTPLFGRSSNAEDRATTWALWPLFRTARDGEMTSRHVLPLFYYKRDGDATTFITPLFGRHRKAEDEHATWLLPFYAGKRDGDRRWHAVLPLFYHERDGDESKLITPLFGRNRRAADRHSTWALWPLFRTARDGDATTTRLLPFYMGARDGEERWDAVPPLFFHQRDAKSKRLITLLFGGYRESEDHHSTWALPLFFHKRDGDKTKLITPLFGRDRKGEDRHSTWALWPLFRTARAGDTLTSRLLPLFWHKRAGDESKLVTPLFGYERQAEDRHSTWALWPLFHTARAGDTLTSRLLPLFWHKRAGDESKLVTPLFGYERQAEDRHSTWALWPLFHTAQDGDTLTSRLLPLFWHKRAGDESKLVTPLFGYDREGEDRYMAWALWPLLRWERDGETTKRQFLPFYASERNGDESMDAVLPLFFSERNRHETTLVTPLFSRFEKLDSKGKVAETDTWMLGPLARLRRDSEGVLGSHVLPLYHWDGDDKTFLSLPWSRGGDEEKGFWTVLGPVLGNTWEDDANNFWALWPLVFGERSATRTALNIGLLLWNSEFRGENDWEWHFALFFNGMKKGEDEARMNLGPYWQEKSVTKARGTQDGKRYVSTTAANRWGVFPLMRFEREAESVESVPKPSDAAGDELKPVLDKETVHNNLLWRVWDSKSITSTDKTGDEPVTETYSRWRVLWRVVHWEKKNDTVALDILPGITYDSTPGTHKSMSFLWRVFRYEWKEDTGTKVHVLFIPFGG